MWYEGNTCNMHLLDLAAKDRVELDELKAVSHLSVNALATSPDGQEP